MVVGVVAVSAVAVETAAVALIADPLVVADAPHSLELEIVW